VIDAGKRTRLVELLTDRSFQKKRVILASGRESDFFIDCKQTVLTAEGHALTGDLMLALLGDLPPADAVAGVELGGCPLASAVSLVSFQRGRPLPALYVRKARKDHGSEKLVEGDKSCSTMGWTGLGQDCSSVVNCQTYGAGGALGLASCLPSAAGGGAGGSAGSG
jgi:hypothetical protein